MKTTLPKHKPSVVTKKYFHGNIIMKNKMVIYSPAQSWGIYSCSWMQHGAKHDILYMGRTMLSWKGHTREHQLDHKILDRRSAHFMLLKLLHHVSWLCLVDRGPSDSRLNHKLKASHLCTAVVNLDFPLLFTLRGFVMANKVYLWGSTWNLMSGGTSKVKS